MARILVIDDDPDVRSSVRRHLEVSGHDVVEAGDGATALTMAREAPVELVITDIYMPGMDGIEFAIRLQSHGERGRIIAMSGGGFADKQDVLERAARLGAVRTLGKPFTREELLEVVAAAMRDDENRDDGDA